MVNVNQAAHAAQAAAAKKRKDEEAQRSANTSTSGRVNSGFSDLESEVTPTRVSVNVENTPKRGRYQIDVQTNEGTLEDGTEVFVKDITLPNRDRIHPDDEEKEMQRIEDQIRIGQKLDHPNHMSLLGYERIDERKHRLVYTKAPGKDLAEIVSDEGLRTEEVLNITEQVASALGYLHDEFTPAIKHGDLSPGNVRYDSETGLVTIIDHGSAVDTVCDDSSHTTRAMTPGFAGPEVGIGRIFTQSDVYGLGALMIYMITKKDPADFYDFTRGQINYEELKPLIEQATTNKDLITLIEDMTNINYKARPSASEVVARVRRLKGLEEEVEESSYDSGVEGSKAEKKRSDWFIPDWNITYISTAKVIENFLRNKRQSYESKLESLKKYRKALSHLERDSQMLDLAIKLYSDISKPISEIENAIERFERDNPERIFGHSRKEVALIGTLYYKSSGYRIDEPERYLRKYCQNPNFRKFIELSAEADLSVQEIGSLCEAIKEFNRSEYKGIDEERYQHYLDELKQSKIMDIDDAWATHVEYGLKQESWERIFNLEEKLRAISEKDKYKRDIRQLAVLLSLEDEGLEYKTWLAEESEDYFDVDLVFSKSKKRKLKEKRPNYDEISDWTLRKILTTSFSIFPISAASGALGASGLLQGAIVVGGAIFTGIVLPEAIDYAKRKRTWNEFHGKVSRHYSPEKVLEALVRTMETIPVSERNNLAGKLKKVGEAYDKKLSPYQMLDIVLEEYYDTSLSIENQKAKTATRSRQPTNFEKVFGPDEQYKQSEDIINKIAAREVSSSYDERMSLSESEEQLEQRTGSKSEYISNLEEGEILGQRTNVSGDHNITQEIPRDKKDRSGSKIGYTPELSSLNHIIMDYDKKTKILEDFVIRPRRNNYIKNKKYNLNNYLIINKKDNF